MVPGAASCGLVAPITLRTIETTLHPSHTIRKTGPPIMYCLREGKKGFERCSLYWSVTRGSGNFSNRAATSFRPFFSSRETISPTRPRWTPSGLTMTKVRSTGGSLLLGGRSPACSGPFNTAGDPAELLVVLALGAAEVKDGPVLFYEHLAGARLKLGT